jgi:hypothetical protein
MEKAAVTGTTAGSRWELRFAVCAAAALCVTCPAVRAQEALRAPAEALVAQAQAQAQAQSDPGIRVQVQTSTLPRMEAQDSGFQAPRVDVSLFSSRPSGLGAVFGMSGFTASQPQPFGLQPTRPSIDLGLRWSQRLQSQQVDITAWRRMNSDDDAYSLVQSRQPVYGARVEMNLSAGHSSAFSAIGGFVGLQLESGARISLKRKDGRPMIYYRTSF